MRQLTIVPSMATVIAPPGVKDGGQDKESVSSVWKLVMRLAICGDKKLSLVPFVWKRWIGREKTSDRNRLRRRTPYF